MEAATVTVECEVLLPLPLPLPLQLQLQPSMFFLIPLRPIISADRIERRNRTECDFLGVLSDPHLLWAGW